MEEDKVTSEQKLYVLLKYKKNLTKCQRFQMYLIGFLNFDKNTWEADAKKWCVDHDQIYGDEPTPEQLEEYGDRGRFHKASPEYTHSTDIFLKELWRQSYCNPKNWLRTAKGWTIIGTIAGLLSLGASRIWQVAKSLVQQIASLLD